MSSAYGFFADDSQWDWLSEIFGKTGTKQIPFAGYYKSYPRISKALFLEYGDPVALDAKKAANRVSLAHPTRDRRGAGRLLGARAHVPLPSQHVEDRAEHAVRCDVPRRSSDSRGRHLAAVESVARRAVLLDAGLEARLGRRESARACRSGTAAPAAGRAPPIARNASSAPRS